MKKLKKIIKLSDPYPSLWYETLCYIKAITGLIFIIFGIFLVLSPLLKRGLIVFGFYLILSPVGETLLAYEEKILGGNFTILAILFGCALMALGLWFLWKIKLVRKLVKALFD